MRFSPLLRRAALALTMCTGTAGAGDAPTVTDAWARATPPGTDVGAAYMVIRGGARPDRLLGGESERAAMVHLHAMEEQDGVAKMRALDALEVPAGARVELVPNSTHLMLMGLRSPLVAGQTFPVTLRFATAGPVTVTVTVRAATAPEDHAQHHH